MVQSTAEANRLMEQQRLGGFDYPNDELSSTVGNCSNCGVPLNRHGYCDNCERDNERDEDDEVVDHSNGVGV